MSKKARYKYSDLTKLQREKVDSGSIEVSLSLDDLAQNFTHGKEILSKRYDQFCSSWEGEWKELLDLQFFLASLLPEDAEPVIERHYVEEAAGSAGYEEKAYAYVYVVWTIGAALEQKVNELFNSGDAMNAILLDVAGTRVLLNMHTTMQNRLREMYARSNSRNLIWEVYPGNNFFGSLDLDRIIRVVGGDGIISAASADSMFLPKKTMYCFFVVGEGPERVMEKVHACPNCSGQSCLYYQLGGCHLQ